MRRLSRAGIALAFVLACAAPARAQNGAEIGVSADGLLTWWTPFPAQVALRVTLPSNSRAAVETFVSVGSADRVSGRGDYGGVFGVQVRRRIGRRDDDGPQPFVAFGGFGGYVRGRYDTYFIPPLMGVIGGGEEWTVAKRVKVRVEVHGVTLLVLPVGVHVAATASVPIGRPR
jgi:hypothetical protein